MFSKPSLSLIAALAISASAAGAARANPIPTSTDEARALAPQVQNAPAAGPIDPADRAVTSTDEARALAARSLPVSPTASAELIVVTSTDEARAVAGAGRQIRIENETLAASPLVASAARRHD